MIHNPYPMIHNSKLIIHTDGGARGNPGPAGIGVVIYDPNGNLIKKYGKYIGDEKTNNEAEYEAVIAALVAAEKLGGKDLQFNLDSELVVRQLNNIYKVKNQRMQKLVMKVHNLETKFAGVKYTYVPREQNKLADTLVNEAIDKAQKFPSPSYGEG